MIIFGVKTHSRCRGSTIFLMAKCPAFAWPMLGSTSNGTNYEGYKLPDNYVKQSFLAKSVSGSATNQALA